jgi:hypothetical protein
MQSTNNEIMNGLDLTDENIEGQAEFGGKEEFI